MTTLSQLIEDCRQRYNAVGDKFFADSEIFDLIYEAQMEVALETQAIEKIFTATTVVGQREYDYPTNALRIFRITYDGERLNQISFLEDDSVTGEDENTSNTSTPRYYSIFADRIFLRPVPDEAKTLKIYAHVTPSQLTSDTDALDVNERYVIFVKDYVLSQMYAKDKNNSMVQYHESRWQRALDRIKRADRKRKIGDVYGVVHNDEIVNLEGPEPFS